jgi:tetratricopeptide (TPR) repeat protein
VAVNPVFPGPRPFTRAESGRFFGRTAEAARLVSEWLTNPVTFLTGPAGIGKTSLLIAGALPFVENRRSSVSLLPVGRLSGRDGTGYGRATGCPVAILPPHNPYSLALLMSWSGSSAPAHLAGMTADDFLRDHAARHPDVLLLAAIDQADDLFAGPANRNPLRRRFLSELAAAVEELPQLRLLISVRPACLPDFISALGDRVRFQLDPMTPEKALAAAGGPGYFTRDAADALVEGVRSSRIVSAPGKEQLLLSDMVEPALLQVVCATLWQSLHEGADVATLAELERFGDAPVDTALSGYCGAAIAAVAAAHDLPVEWLRNWLISTFITEVADLSVPRDTDGAPPTVVKALEDRYLLRGDAVAGRYRLLSGRLAEPLRGTAAPLTSEAPDPDDYLREAERARVMGEHDLAHKIASLVLRMVDESDLRRHAEAYSLIADVAYERGQFDEAENYYRKAMALFQARSQGDAVARLCAAVARTFIARRKFAEALEQLSAAVNRSSDLMLQEELAEVMARLTEGTARKPPFAEG